MNAVEFKNVTVKFNGNVALDNVSFEIKDKEFIAIMGPNGAGKTTLLKTILGLVYPFKGEVKVYGYNPIEHASKIRKMIGYVPQREYISRDIPVKVKDVVLMGMLIHKNIPRFARKVDIETAIEALRIVGMDWAWDKPFNALSGGQQQRVLIARSIATNPKLLILDEPLTGVDVATQTVIAEFLGHLKTKDITIIIVTHDVNPISHLSDKIMILNRKVIAYDKPNNVLKPEILSKVYGDSIKVFEYHPCPIIVTGDTHG